MFYQDSGFIQFCGYKVGTLQSRLSNTRACCGNILTKIDQCLVANHIPYAMTLLKAELEREKDCPVGNNNNKHAFSFLRCKVYPYLQKLHQTGTNPHMAGNGPLPGLTETKAIFSGLNSLVYIVGGEAQFIKLAISQSYFFSYDLAQTRMLQIVSDYTNNKPIPARWQGKRISGVREQCKYDYCDVDTNGNAKLRSVIRKLCGYDASAGKSTPFVDYKISHIWGQAFDPRYFTNLWNVVLIPSWANDLMDKPNPDPGSLAAKMQDTYKKICSKLYKFRNNQPAFNQIGISPLPVIGNDYVGGEYDFFEIQAKGQLFLGRIIRKQVII